MEQVKHIESITVENFKCFDHFSVNDFGMYNIILGDNNVGKSSFLESLLFDENISQTIENFQAVLVYKGIASGDKAFKVNPFIFFNNRYSHKQRIDISINFKTLKSLDYSIETIKSIDVPNEHRLEFISNLNSLRSNEEILKISYHNKVSYKNFDTILNFDGTNNFVNYVFSSIYYSKDLIGYYVNFFSESKETKSKLINNLKILIPNISDIEITLNFINKDPIIGIWLSDKDSLLPLPMFGDGIIRLFRIIMEISVCENKYLCIDEIDTGIHYSKYKDFSRIVLNTAMDNNVQLFISTHNNEFLKSFKEVLEEKKFISYQEQTKCFTLKKLPKGEIKAYRYDFEEFEFAIEQENELR